MADSEGPSTSSSLSQVVLYFFAVAFVLLVLAGAAALVKYAWHALAA